MQGRGVNSSSHSYGSGRSASTPPVTVSRSLRQYSFGRTVAGPSSWISAHHVTWSRSRPSGKGSSGTSRAYSCTTGTIATGSGPTTSVGVRSGFQCPGSAQRGHGSAAGQSRGPPTELSWTPGSPRLGYSSVVPRASPASSGSSASTSKGWVAMVRRTVRSPRGSPGGGHVSGVRDCRGPCHGAGDSQIRSGRIRAASPRSTSSIPRAGGGRHRRPGRERATLSTPLGAGRVHRRERTAGSTGRRPNRGRLRLGRRPAVEYGLGQ